MPQKSIPTSNFPLNFLWGAATAAHQVEGNNHNDWSAWEKENANKLAATAKQRLVCQSKYTGTSAGLNWEKIRLQAENPQNYISGIACDHYRRFKSDFDLAKKLGHNAHRLSIEWSRIEPKQGRFNQREVEHYKEVIKSLRQRGLESFVTLWHFTLPTWVAQQGGWRNPKTADDFTAYARKIASELNVSGNLPKTALGARTNVKFWLTLNEPMIYAAGAHLQGVMPPQEKNPISYLRVISNLIRAHQQTYTAIKKISPQAQVGLAKNNIFFEAYQNRLVNRALKKLARWWWNNYFLDKIHHHLDFIGLNYYFHNLINYGFNKNENEFVSDLGWELYPKGIYYVLKDLAIYQKPIYVTENGLADAKDAKRAWFIDETLKQVQRALNNGVDVRGYFHWSLLDNFEWDKGFWPRFGLVEVDYKTQTRFIRKSALAIFPSHLTNNSPTGKTTLSVI